MSNVQDVQDGSTTFITGQNAALVPDQVPESGYYSGVNTSVSKGVLTSRWGLDEIVFKDTKQTYKTQNNFVREYAPLFYTGKYQAIIPYSISGREFWIVVVSGVIFLVDQNDFSISVIDIKGGGHLNEHSPRINSSDAGRYLVLFDFPARPVIIEGSTARRSSEADKEIPVSRLGAFNQTRLIIANGGNEFTASDPAAYGFPYGPISFTEVLTQGSAYYTQAFQIVTNYNNDPITGIYALPATDTSTGIGPTLVSTRRGVYSYQTQNDRAAWSQPNFGTQFIPNVGFSGPRAMTGVNSDVMFLSFDGQLRSASMSRSEQTKYSKVPMSREVSNYLKVTDPSLLEYARVCYFQNKVFVTANPYRVAIKDSNYVPIFDYANGGFVVLELDNAATFTTGDSNPAWAGLWTGIRPMDMMVSNERAFIVSKEGGLNKFYEVRPDRSYDTIGNPKRIRPIQSRVYTRDYDFKSPFNDKELKTLEIDANSFKGECSIEVRYKTSQSNRYQLWGTFNHNAPWRVCDVMDSCNLNGLQSHDFKDIPLGSPEEDTCNIVSNETNKFFRKVQLLLTVKGIGWRIEGFIIRGTMTVQNTTLVPCEQYPIVEVCKDCTINDWILEEDLECQKIPQTI